MNKVNISDYKYAKWEYPVNVIDLLKGGYAHTWFDIFTENETDINKLNIFINNLIKKKVNILPYPKLVFRIFKHLDLEDIKVVMIGQDPYFNMKEIKKEEYPEAMGISFSVPDGIPVPSSLKNIYKNLKKFEHIENIPKKGDLTNWVEQGCFLMNASLTVSEGEKNSHKKVWANITSRIIKYISDEKKFCIFVLWGGDALKNLNFINTKKHKIIISSHPSGMSCYSNLGNYPSFSETDHFGKINKYLENKKMDIIDWNI